MFKSNKMQKDPETSGPQVISGPICAINPGKKGDGLYKGGALTSAFMSAFL